MLALFAIIGGATIAMLSALGLVVVIEALNKVKVR